MSQNLAITWRDESPSLHAAYITTVQGQEIYAGYVAVSPGYDDWRGYVGRGFIPVGLGPRAVMQRLVEQHTRDIWARGEDLHHAS